MQRYMSVKKGAGQKRKSKSKYLIDLVKSIDTPNFVMNPAELYQYLPEGKRFIIKRAYWITKPSGAKISGQHAHLKEEEVFIVIQGNTDMILDDSGERKKKVTLNTNNIVWIPRYVWHGFANLSSDCIILALTSTNYSPNRSDYIEDYEEFKKRIKK